MGKDSLIKSTTKKAGSKKEKKPSKKKPAAKAAGAPVTKNAPAKNAPPKNAPPKNAPIDTPVKPKSAKKAEPALTPQDLLFKQFSKPQPLDDAPPPTLDLSAMTAPPLIASTDPQEAARLRALLEQRFSMEEIDAAAQEPAAIAPPVAKAPPRPPVSLEELLFRPFSTPRPLDEPPPPALDLSRMTAPPIISSTDPQEIARLQALLDLRFNMEEINAAAQKPVAVAPPVAEISSQPQEVGLVKAPEPTIVAQPQAEVAPSAQTASAPEPTIEPIPAQTPEPQITETPAPASTPAPEPVTPKLEETKATPVPKPEVVVPPPQEESKHQAPPPPSQPSATDSGWRPIKIGIAIVAAVFLLILWGSFGNSGKYFVMPKKGAIEIWRGTFSPTGKEFVAVLHGVEPASTVKDAYRREEIFPILSNYYIAKADALLDVSGLPDYKAISEYLLRAKEYALTDELRTAVQTRMDNIQRLSLMYKAEIDISKGTVPSLQSALQTLKEVQRLTTEPSQLEALDQKIAGVNRSLASLEVKSGEAAKDQAEQMPSKETNHTAPEK